MIFSTFRVVCFALLIAAAPGALAATWYVNGVSGSDTNTCLSPPAACKTIAQAISLTSSGDSIMVASATYKENLTVGISLRIIGASANTTIIDGGGSNTVVTVSSSAAGVTLANLTVQNGAHPDGGGIHNNGALTINHSVVRGNTSKGEGGGIYNNGTLTVNVSTVSGNKVSASSCGFCGSSGGGIENNGTLTINNSTVSGNTAAITCGRTCAASGGGISNTNSGKLTINWSTISGNTATATAQLSTAHTDTEGAGIHSLGAMTITNSTIANNTAKGGNSYNRGGGMESDGPTSISSSTITGNSAGTFGGGIFGSVTAMQNSIVADNVGENCSFITVTSTGYNLSTDDSCKLSGVGDRNNVNPMLGELQNNGGPTETMLLLEGSPAIDAGNPSGCTDGSGHVLKTDQRGMPRPDKEDTSGCDIGAVERQSD